MKASALSICSIMLKSFLSPVTKRHVERKILQTSPQHLFDIIVDVDQYRHFLPLCTHSEVLTERRRKWDDGDAYSFQAELTVGLPPLFTETYVSDVTVHPAGWRVETASVKSQNFDSLSSRWRLSLPEDGSTSDAVVEPECDVQFEVEITVTDPLIASTLDRLLEEIAGRQVEAFAARCREVPVRRTELLAPAPDTRQ
jgi:coenzyme Q-binding protein COQ10